MIVERTPFKITEGVWMLGNPAFPSYICKAKEGFVLLEPELACALFLIEKQTGDLGIDLNKVETCIVLHGHYDHVMMVAPLIDKYQHIKVVAHPKAVETMKNEEVMDRFRRFCEYTCNRLGEKCSCNYSPVNALSISELKEIPVFELPGHSPCSIGVVINGVFFVSDALGFFGREIKHSPLFFYNYEHYIKSIERIRTIIKEVKAVALGHNAVFLGSEMQEAVDIALKEAERAREEIAKIGYDEEALFKRIFVGEYEKFYPPEVIRACSHYLVKRAQG